VRERAKKNLMSNGYSSAQDGVIFDVVDEEACVVEHLNDVTDSTHLKRGDVELFHLSTQRVEVLLINFQVLKLHMTIRPK
jgi:hypothetical protein